MLDVETKEHVASVQTIAMYLANKLEISDTDKLILKQAAILHDIGKIKLDENILNAPRQLTDDEFEVVKTHSLHGYNIAKEYGVPEEVAIHRSAPSNAASRSSKILTVGFVNRE